MKAKPACPCGFVNDTVELEDGHVFDGGAVLHFITDDHLGGIERTVHLCAFCTEHMLTTFPWLREDWERPEVKPPTRKNK